MFDHSERYFGLFQTFTDFFQLFLLLYPFPRLSDWDSAAAKGATRTSRRTVTIDRRRIFQRRTFSLHSWSGLEIFRA